jgi:hypothetical protein
MVGMSQAGGLGGRRKAKVMVAVGFVMAKEVEGRLVLVVAGVWSQLGMLASMEVWAVGVVEAKGLVMWMKWKRKSWKWTKKSWKWTGKGCGVEV